MVYFKMVSRLEVAISITNIAIIITIISADSVTLINQFSSDLKLETNLLSTTSSLRGTSNFPVVEF